MIYGGERRIILHRGPRQVGTEVVDLSDDDSGGAPAGEEEIPRSASLELGAQPESLLLYLRFKHDAFEESIKSLRGPLEPLLQKYSAILNQLE